LLSSTLLLLAHAPGAALWLLRAAHAVTARYAPRACVAKASKNGSVISGVADSENGGSHGSWLSMRESEISAEKYQRNGAVMAAWRYGKAA